jgi:hypothetical protein
LVNERNESPKRTKRVTPTVKMPIIPAEKSPPPKIIPIIPVIVRERTKRVASTVETPVIPLPPPSEIPHHPPKQIPIIPIIPHERIKRVISPAQIPVIPVPPQKRKKAKKKIMKR